MDREIHLMEEEQFLHLLWATWQLKYDEYIEYRKYSSKIAFISYYVSDLIVCVARGDTVSQDREVRVITYTKR